MKLSPQTISTESKAAERPRRSIKAAAVAGAATLLLANCTSEVVDKDIDTRVMVQLTAGGFVSSPFLTDVELESCEGELDDTPLQNDHIKALFDVAVEEKLTRLKNVELDGITCDSAELTLPETIGVVWRPDLMKSFENVMPFLDDIEWPTDNFRKVEGTFADYEGRERVLIARNEDMLISFDNIRFAQQ